MGGSHCCLLMVLNDKRLKLALHKHGVRPGSDVLLMRVPCNYARFKWISMLTFSAVCINMITFYLQRERDARALNVCSSFLRSEPKQNENGPADIKRSLVIYLAVRLI